MTISALFMLFGIFTLLDSIILGIGIFAHTDRLGRSVFRASQAS